MEENIIIPGLINMSTDDWSITDDYKFIHLPSSYVPSLEFDIVTHVKMF